MIGRKRDGKKGGDPKPSVDEDSALWEFVAASVGPARGKHRVNDVETPPVKARVASKVHPAHSAANDAAGSRQPKPLAATAPAPSPRPPPRAIPPPQPVAIERKRARRIARGSEEIEARIDLHGMTQAAAHAELTAFIRRCSASGLRLVLVITGKGGVGTRHHDDDGLMPRQRGVLKRNVPRWLAEHDLSPLVVSWWSAHVRHGGEGALYVQLRVHR